MALGKAWHSNTTSLLAALALLDYRLVSAKGWLIFEYDILDFFIILGSTRWCLEISLKLEALWPPLEKHFTMRFNARL